MEKIVRLKQAFEREKIDGYFIPKNDQFLNMIEEKKETVENILKKFKDLDKNWSVKFS